MTRMLLVSSAVLFILGSAHPARAADGPAIDVAGGYTFSRIIADGEGMNFPSGWFGSISGNATPTVGIVGEVTGAYRTEQFNVSNAGVTFSIVSHAKMYSFMAGPKFRSRANTSKVFGQLLIGGVTLASSGTGSYDGRTVSVSDSNTYFAISPGGGVDVKIADHLGVRIGANFQLIRSPLADSERDWGKVLQTVIGIMWTRH